MARPEVRSVDVSKGVQYKVKIGLPGIHFLQVFRPRLKNIVPESLNYRVTWINAPAGYGKTTALVQSVQAAMIPVAWLTLDESDNDFNRFWKYLILAVAEILPGLKDRFDGFTPSADALPTQMMIDGLLDHLQQSEDEIILILDNIHWLNNPAVLDTFRFFIRYMPEKVHLILSGRGGDIGYSPRMGVAQEISHLSREDLRFTFDEIQAYCALAGIHLDQGAMETLVSCSEGWPVGVVGLLEPLIAGRDASLLKPDCLNLNGELADYIEAEILKDLSESDLDFLVKTSILPKLTPAFCRALTGRDDSSAALKELSRKNVLLDPIPGQVDQFRLHRLLRICLNRRLQQQYGDTARFLHLSAADWHESRGELVKAFSYLKISGDLSRITTFVRRHGPDLLRVGESGTLAAWLNALPSEAVEADELLRYCQAWTALIHRNEPLFEKTLAVIESKIEGSDGQTAQLPQTRSQAELLILRGMMSYAKGDHGRAAELLEEAAGLTRNTLLFSSGIDLTNGQVTLTGGLMGQYGKISGLDEDFFGSLQRIEHAWGARGIRQGLRGELLYERNQLNEACPHLMQGMREAMFYKCNGGLTGAVIAISSLRRSGGDLAGAGEIVRIVRKWLTKHDILHQDPPLDAWQSFLELEQGHESSAAEWIRRSRLQSRPALEGSRIFEYLILARIYLRKGQLEQCEQLLTELKVLIEEEPSTWYEIKILLLRAVCRNQRGAKPGALADLTEALKLGQQEGYLRTFLDEGKAIEGLLRELIQDHSMRSGWPEKVRIYARKLYEALTSSTSEGVDLACICPQFSPTADDSLTMRELEVLRRLAQGQSNKEIAEELHVSLTTVKFHCSNIYRKLNVSRRQSAILLALEKKLI